MTIALFDTDPYQPAFTAKVVSCRPDGDNFRVVLNRTAFFPEQGGQYADTGTLGDASVLDAQIHDGIITHITDRPLDEGTCVSGTVCFEKRYDRMQNHSGEHIVSGLIHTHFGYDNVGFHLSDDDLTLDTSGPLTREQLLEIEAEANEAVYRNLPIIASYPDEETLKTLDYRSKLDLTEHVRIVEIPGVDRCACCAPHVRRTGEIGMIKILDAIHYKGGMRIHLACGRRALADYNMRYANIVRIAQDLHVKQNEAALAVDRLRAQLSADKQEIAALHKELTEAKLSAFSGLERTDGSRCFFESGLDAQGLRELVNAAVSSCGVLCAAFSGNDADGYQFVIGSASVPLRSRAKEITKAIDGRGGGSDQMICGTAKASAAAIRAYIEAFS